MSNSLMGVPFMVTEREFGAMQKQLENIDATTAKLSAAVYGNGKEGLVSTTIRIEENVKETRNDVANLKESVESLTATLAAKRDVTFKDLVWDNKGLIGKTFVALIVLSVIIHALMPSNITVWDLIAFL